jgi:thiamine biosynthesis lipoprotein
MRLRSLKTILLLLWAALLLADGCRWLPGSPGLFRQSRLLMGTIVEITVVSDDEEKAHRDIGDAFQEIARIESLLGAEHGGEITRLNRMGFPGGFQVSEEVFGVISRAAELGREMEGSFDVTLGPLMSVWSFGEGSRVPSRAMVEAARVTAGWDGVVMDEGSRRVAFTRSGASLDLGGIGKGYAVDRAASLLKDRGVEAGIVNAGGDLSMWGRKPGGSLWRVGIQHPRRPDALLGRLLLTDRAVVTSGDYERNFTAGGRLYHHILDPNTGYPAEGTRSVTVAAATAEAADAYATGIFVMGPDKGRRFLEGHPEVDGIIIDGEGRLFVSSRLKGVFQEENR